mgnify:CR=1 FL=1
MPEGCGDDGDCGEEAVTDGQVAADVVGEDTLDESVDAEHQDERAVSSDEMPHVSSLPEGLWSRKKVPYVGSNASGLNEGENMVECKARRRGSKAFK